LLDLGAEVDYQDGWGTALSYAAAYKHMEIMALLLARGADVNAADKNGRTALFVAAEHGYEEIVTWLLGRGAWKDLRDEEGLSAADVARAEGYEKVAALLT